MADGKWISGLEAETPLVQAARHVLAVRLAVVGERLPQALHEADRDPEHVHQLRVGTRRADAALRIFADCLPRKTYRSARRRLRRLRRAAGAARDWDVFLDELRQRRPHQPPKERAGLDFLCGYALGQRAAAQEGLLAAGEEEGKEFSAFVDEVVSAVRPADGGGDTLLVLARPLLAGLVGALAQTAAADLKDYACLHRVRIAGKRLRYAMEVFAGCFPAPFTETLYPLVEEMQEVLGRANDSHVAGERLAALRGRLSALDPAGWKRWQAGIEALRRSHQRRLPQERRRFLRAWEHWQQPETVFLWRLLLGEDFALDTQPAPATGETA
jgi:CHAD domain-containing protein